MSKCPHGYKVWRKCPVCREDPERWERILASHGLGIDQPLTDNSDDSPFPEVFAKDDFAYLRKIIDKGDRFMEAHEIKKVRGTNENRIIPDWTQNNGQVRRILLTAFPKLESSAAQKQRALRWLKFIYSYYRLVLPRPIIMKEMDMTHNAMKMLVRTLNKVSLGLTRHGKKRQGTPSVLPVREPGERGNE